MLSSPFHCNCVPLVIIQVAARVYTLQGQKKEHCQHGLPCRNSDMKAWRRNPSHDEAAPRALIQHSKTSESGGKSPQWHHRSQAPVVVAAAGAARAAAAAAAAAAA